MLQRLLSIAAIVALAMLSAIAFTGASAANGALSLLADARATRSEEAKSAMLDAALSMLASDWSRAIHWHAGAAEALSAVYFEMAEMRDGPPLYRQSAHWAVKSLQLDPVQPNAWARLAALAEAHYDNSICDIERCLANSRLTGPYPDPETACLRLQIQNRRTALAADDAELGRYLSVVSAAEAAQCLQFLPPADLFRALLRTRHTPDRVARNRAQAPR